MYELAVETARRLGKEGFTILTGAGPGVMQAANKGARDVGALSIGLNIELPEEQHANPHLDRVVDFRYFFVRKTMLVKYSSAFVIFYLRQTLIGSKFKRNFPPSGKPDPESK